MQTLFSRNNSQRYPILTFSNKQKKVPYLDVDSQDNIVSSPPKVHVEPIYDNTRRYANRKHFSHLACMRTYVSRIVECARGQGQTCICVRHHLKIPNLGEGEAPGRTLSRGTVGQSLDELRLMIRVDHAMLFFCLELPNERQTLGRSKPASFFSALSRQSCNQA